MRIVLESRRYRESPFSIVRILGDIETADVPVFEREIGRLFEEMDITRVIVDFSSVGFLTSLGIGALIKFSKDVRAARGDFRLYGANPRIRGIFEITQVSRIFDLHETEAEALDAHFKPRAAEKKGFLERFIGN